MNRCIISGLLSVGANVEDLRSYPLPLSRMLRVPAEMADPRARLAGRSELVAGRVLRCRGINVDKDTERKIENLFFREDFRRVAMDDVGMLDFPARALEGTPTRFSKR